MSLNRVEMASTGEDLRRHLAASGLSQAELCTWLGLDTGQLDSILAMNGAESPRLVWLVRDALDQQVTAVGGDAGGWTVLTDAARPSADAWFGLAAVPPQP